MRRLPLFLFAVMATACGASGSGRDAATAQASDPCYDADIAVERVWNSETKVQVQAQVMSWGGEIGVDVARRASDEVANTMDRVADDWARMRKAVCKDHFVRKSLGADEYQRRVDCLDKLLVRQRVFVTALSSPKQDVSEELAELSAEIDSCQ